MAKEIQKESIQQKKNVAYGLPFFNLARPSFVLKLQTALLISLKIMRA